MKKLIYFLLGIFSSIGILCTNPSTCSNQKIDIYISECDFLQELLIKEDSMIIYTLKKDVADCGTPHKQVVEICTGTRQKENIELSLILNGIDTAILYSHPYPKKVLISYTNSIQVYTDKDIGLWLFD